MVYDLSLRDMYLLWYAGHQAESLKLLCTVLSQNTIEANIVIVFIRLTAASTRVKAPVIVVVVTIKGHEYSIGHIA